jgi:hypothetical protein
MSWHVAIDSGEGVYPEGEELPYTDEKTLDVAERTIIVLIGRR